ncbi:hypothetical protein ACFPRL_19650 [Pseudoclavibacter helvolus]
MAELMPTATLCLPAGCWMLQRVPSSAACTAALTTRTCWPARSIAVGPDAAETGAGAAAATGAAAYWVLSRVTTCRPFRGLVRRCRPIRCRGAARGRGTRRPWPRSRR